MYSFGVVTTGYIRSRVHIKSQHRVFGGMWVMSFPHAIHTFLATLVESFVW